MANRLLVLPSSIEGSVTSAIEQARRIVREGDFLTFGVGQFIIHNGVRIIEGKQTEYFESGEVIRFLDRRMFFNKFDDVVGWLEPLAFQQEARPIISANLSDTELVSLAKAAMRRSRVKRELHEQLAIKFRDEMRKRHPRRVSS